jgi:DNA-binding response OmpR family regulator
MDRSTFSAGSREKIMHRRADRSTSDEPPMSATTSDATIPDEAEILLVEDDQELAALYAQWLEGTYTVRTVADGIAALEVVDDEVDVVLLDRQLPKLSGTEVLSTVRERDLSCQVVVVSGVEPDFDLVSMEFDGYLVKPVTEEELRNAVERTLARASYSKKLQEFHSLVQKRHVLDEEKTMAERESSEEYAELEARLDDVSRQLDDIAATVADPSEETEATTPDSEPDWSD